VNAFTKHTKQIGLYYLLFHRNLAIIFLIIQMKNDPQKLKISLAVLIKTSPEIHMFFKFCALAGVVECSK